MDRDIVPRSGITGHGQEWEFQRSHSTVYPFLLSSYPNQEDLGMLGSVADGHERTWEFVHRLDEIFQQGGVVLSNQEIHKALVGYSIASPFFGFI